MVMVIVYLVYTEYSCIHVLHFVVIFDSDDNISMEALSQLKHVGITLRELEEADTISLQRVVGIDSPIYNDSFLVLKMWVQGNASLHPTWRHFFWALRKIKLNHLADQIEAFLSFAAVEQAATNVSLGNEAETKGRKEHNDQDQGEVAHDQQNESSMH